MNLQNANVLFGDVKGYSSLTNQQLKTFAETILPLAAQVVQQFDTIHVNTWGDGIVVATESVVDIAEIAVNLRDLFTGCNWDRYGLPPLDIRLSVHHGEYHRGTDPFTSNGLLSGRTIILAARIEPITLPGRIWMTETAAIMLRDAQSDKPSPFFATDEIGEVVLPKAAGLEKVFHLRRQKEIALTEAERTSVLDASGAPRDRAASSGDADAGPQVEVCIGIVTRDEEVLVVKRNQDSSQLGWMFPSGKKLAVDDERFVVVKEVQQETGISCLFREKIALVEKHPLTGAKCHFFHLQPLNDTQPQNVDAVENAEVKFIPISQIEELIPKHLTPEVADFLRRRVA